MQRTTYRATWNRLGTLAVGAVGGVLFALACQGEATERPKPTSSTTEQPAQPSAAAPAEPAQPRAAGPAALPWGDLRGTFPLDPGHSFVVFRTTHAGASYTWGRFLDVKGELTLGERVEQSGIEVTVNAASVFTGVKKRDDHLRSPDFLDAARFPTITFRAKEVEPAGDGKVRVRGELTLHGVTKTVEVEGRFVGRGKHPMKPNVDLVGFHAEFDIRRSEFGMDKLVGPAGDEIRLFVSVEGARAR